MLSALPASALPNPAQAQLPTEESYDLVLLAASTLHANGESTTGTLHAAAQLGAALQIPSTLVPTWGELLLHVRGEQVRVTARAYASNHS